VQPVQPVDVGRNARLFCSQHTSIPVGPSLY
jgi:hypothetical protein